MLIDFTQPRTLASPEGEGDHEVVEGVCLRG